MNAWVQSIILVVVATIWLVLSYLAYLISEAKHWLNQELDIQVTWLELLKATVFFMSGLFVTSLVLAALQN